MQKNKDVSKPYAETHLHMSFLSAEKKQKLLEEHQQLMEENKRLVDELKITVTSTLYLLEELSYSRNPSQRKAGQEEGL